MKNFNLTSFILGIIVALFAFSVFTIIGLISSSSQGRYTMLISDKIGGLNEEFIYIMDTKTGGLTLTAYSPSLGFELGYQGKYPDYFEYSEFRKGFAKNHPQTNNFE
jgi:hypothetical protein